jgi:hypothetical protein
MWFNHELLKDSNIKDIEKNLINYINEKDIQIDKYNNVNQNILTWSCYKGYDQLSSLLIRKYDKRLSINDKDINEKTSISYAIENNMTFTIELVIS